MLSIYPEYVEKILNGSKRFEFRRRLPCALFGGTRVVIYATAPISAVVGEFLIGEHLALPPSQLWAVSSEFAGIDRDKFDTYFDGVDVAHALSIVSPTRYDQPRRLADYGVKVAPMSYVYIDARRVSR